MSSAAADSSDHNTTPALRASFFRPDETFGLDNIFIGISGMIGAGKTTLCTALAESLGVPAYYEPVMDNSYLADFYKDQKKYSFPLQIWLLNQRFKQQQQIIWQGKGGVQDRTIYEDSVFAKMLWRSGNMETRDYETYVSLFANMSNFMKKPNIIVHLEVSPEESYERIKMRSRNMESSIPLEYLQELYQGYEEFIDEISRVIPVIKVNYSKFRTAEEMAEVIKREYNQMRLIKPVYFERPGAM
eukprot:TRINITY_DN3555_c0_g1_i1.p1 TRINITY_DN3555_c0_g1~~TRINITY_DN3555_c0_g1_i1.p1  ORF type:complete len:244 (-),score=37.87 TRINITY_DN3555_c0_g1_i1:46-777(-)